MHRFLAARFLMALHHPSLNPESVPVDPIQVPPPAPSSYSQRSERHWKKRSHPSTARKTKKKVPTATPLQSVIVSQVQPHAATPKATLLNDKSSSENQEEESKRRNVAQVPVALQPVANDWSWVPEEFKGNNSLLASNQAIHILDDVSRSVNELLFGTIHYQLAQIPSETLDKSLLAQATRDSTSGNGIRATPLASLQSLVNLTQGLPVTQPTADQKEKPVVATQDREKVNTQTEYPLATQERQMETAVLTTQIDAMNTQHLDMQTDAQMNSQADSQKTTQVERNIPEPLPTHIVYTEAFASAPLEVLEAQPEMISLEDLSNQRNGSFKEQQKYRGWQKVEAPQHWPTLSWVDPSTRSLPLIGSNTLKLLEKMVPSGAVQHEEAGLVFGEIAAGWSVFFSGNERAEKPILLTLSGQRLGEDDTSQVRNFIFLNVSPGADVLYFAHASEKQLTFDATPPTAGVVTPVLPGVATYLDLTRINTETVTGRVITASSKNGTSFIGATVSVVGQVNQTTQSDSQGNFSIYNVLTASNLPLHVETEVIKSDRVLGFKHRHQVLPGNLQNLQLYRTPSRQIRNWISQIEHGVSSQSGLAVGAVPLLLQQYPASKLTPEVRAIPSNSSLSPETYLLSSTGELKLPEEKTLSRERAETRFLGAELPEGLGLAQVVDEAGTLVWGELIISSPGVVNVVGSF